MMSIMSSVAQQCELINELGASLVGGKPAVATTACSHEMAHYQLRNK